LALLCETMTYFTIKYAFILLHNQRVYFASSLAHFQKNAVMILHNKGVIQKQRWQYFGLFWPPTHPWLTFSKEFHQIYAAKSTYCWYSLYHLSTSSPQRSFWITPRDYVEECLASFIPKIETLFFQEFCQFASKTML